MMTEQEVYQKLKEIRDMADGMAIINSLYYN